MVTFEQLHAQNHKLTELANVFRYLIQDRAMCDTSIANSLFFDYAKQLKDHLDLVDKNLCRHLISHPDQMVKNTAQGFLSGSNEIKRIFSKYCRDWCAERRQELLIDDHQAFVKDTNEMFNLVLERIQLETEHLYPLIRRLEESERKVA